MIISDLVENITDPMPHLSRLLPSGLVAVAGYSIRSDRERKYDAGIRALNNELPVELRLKESSLGPKEQLQHIWGIEGGLASRLKSWLLEAQKTENLASGPASPAMTTDEAMTIAEQVAHYEGVVNERGRLTSGDITQLKEWAEILGKDYLRMQGYASDDKTKALFDAEDIKANRRLTDRIYALIRSQSISPTVDTGTTDNAQIVPGGIDLNTAGMGWKVRKDAAGGVEMTVDPAMIERIKREGIDSLAPVIFRVTPVVNVWALIGLEPPKKQEERLAGV